MKKRKQHEDAVCLAAKRPCFRSGQEQCKTYQQRDAEPIEAARRLVVAENLTLPSLENETVPQLKRLIKSIGGIVGGERTKEALIMKAIDSGIRGAPVNQFRTPLPWRESPFLNVFNSGGARSIEGLLHLSCTDPNHPGRAVRLPGFTHSHYQIRRVVPRKAHLACFIAKKSN